MEQFLIRIVSLNTTNILSDFSPFSKPLNQKLPKSPTSLSISSIKSKYNLELEDLINDVVGKINVAITIPQASILMIIQNKVIQR